MVKQYLLNLVKQESLEANIEVFKLQEGFFQHLEDLSNILYVRECTRVIYDAMNMLRQESNKDHKLSNKSAVIGQPGIGKSFSLYYFAYRFLQEDDVDVVVLQIYEIEEFQVFHKVEVPEHLSGTVDVSLMGEIKKLLKSFGKKAVLLVDMHIKIMPEIVRVAGRGFTVYSCSPAPYVKHLEKSQQKFKLEVFAPPPLSVNETKAIYNDCDDYVCKKHRQLTFEDYFNLFGGTLRPMNDPNGELKKMTRGAEKLQKEDPSNILKVIQGGPDEAAENSTHAIFCDQGGEIEKQFQTSGITSDTVRRYRSGFAKFWFIKYVAPAILYKHYTREVLYTLYSVNAKASGGRGLDFEDIFHHFLPLGDWWMTEVPEEKPKVKEVVSRLWNAASLFLFSNNINVNGQNNKGQALKLSGVTTVQRYIDENNEYDLSRTKWQSIQEENETENQTEDEEDQPIQGKKRKSNQTEQKATAPTTDDKRDVAHLIKTWLRNKKFYWIPYGKQFPGIDAVFKDGNYVYFIQVKTGKTADEMTRFVAESLDIVHLLLQILSEQTDVSGLTTSLLLGTEPGCSPSVGLRKRRKLSVPNGGMQYVVAPQSSADRREKQGFKLDWDAYTNHKQEFLNFKASQERLANRSELKNENPDTDSSSSATTSNG